MEAVFEAYEVWNRRISTAKLNQWLGEALEANPPPAVSGRRIKIRYMTQVKARPPTFAVFGNQLDALPKSYTRYLVNSSAREPSTCPACRSGWRCARARIPSTRSAASALDQSGTCGVSRRPPVGKS